MAWKFIQDAQRTPNWDMQPFEVTLHSPIEIVGAFVYMLREFFQTPDIPWSWKNNNTTTGILIEAGNEEEIATANGKPALFVNKGQTVYERMSIGDLDQDQPETLELGLKHFIAMGKTSISVECTSPEHGESALLGDVVQQFLQMSSNEIQGYFHFQDMSPVVLNSTSRFDKDVPFYNTPVMFQLNFEVRWATIPVAPSLKNLSLRIAESSDPATFFRDIYLK